MKIFKMRVGQFCGAIALGSLLLSSCSTTDEQYAQWNGEPTLIDAGPDRQPAPKPDAMPAPRSEVVTADGSLEPLVAAPPEPVEASYQPESVEKKRFRLFGRRDKKESREVETASQVSESAPVYEAVTADGSMESLVATAPKPVDVSYQPDPVEKKKFKLFGKRDKDKDKDKMESGDMETASHVSYAGSENKQIPVVEVS